MSTSLPRSARPTTSSNRWTATAWPACWKPIARGPPRRRRTGEASVARILLVEDNEMNRDMLSRRLYKRGYEVLIAKEGGEGIAMARSQSPDLILMDMSLPVVDGWEATRRIKAESGTRS